MTSIKYIVCSILTAMFIVLTVRAQDPEARRLQEESDALRRRAYVLMSEKKYDETIALFRGVVRLWNETGRFSTRNYYDLAQALTAANRIEEALDAYRHGVIYEPAKGELWINASQTSYAMDYAILLAKCERADEAKAVYYYGLRRFNEQTHPGGKDYEAIGGHQEPFPFLVVFDQDPSMTVWQYTPERLTAAALLIKLAGLGPQATPHAMKQVRDTAPDWINPAMYMVWQGVVDRKEADRFAEAASLARTPEEREWVSAYRDVFESDDWQVQLERWTEVANKMAAIGAARRKASVVPEQARQNLKNIHHKTAVTRDP